MYCLYAWETRCQSRGVRCEIEGFLEMTSANASICEYWEFEYVL